ncbi:peptidoglycan DD-metalloendopeptidase family protein [Janibacter sp. FSL W8-0316]|uniref:peptidoglycan DD-metalloendopeptidase family protein n=1 Tax=Janibacter sp. FSL W8-0316 TaxID=2975325 RepID=UPI0030FBC1A7
MPRPARPLATRRARALTGAALSVCLLTGAGYAFAADPDPQQEKDRVDGQLSDAQGDLHETSKDLLDAYSKLKSTRSKLPGARSAAKSAEQAETTAKGEYDDAVAAYDLAKANEDKAERDLKSTSSKITTSRRAVASFAGQVYQQQGMGSMSVAVGSEDPGAFVDKMIMAESVGDSQSSALEELSTSRANLVSTGDKLSALRKKTSDAKATKETKLAAARTASDKADRTQRSLETLESDQTTQAADLRAAKREDQKKVDGLQAESDKLTKILEERARKARIREAEIRKAREEQAAREADARRRAQQSTSSDDTGSAAPADPNPPAPTSSGVLQAPSNAPVSSEFGLRFHPIHQTWRLHAGRDYAGACGSPVYAATDGTVIAANPPSSTGGYGNQIVIDHGIKRGSSLATTYNHLQSFAVRSGHVSRGQVIGYVGTTGTSTGCHLHFETRANGTPVDPRGWL